MKMKLNVPQSLKGNYDRITNKDKKKTNICLFFRGYQLKGRSLSNLNKMVSELNSTYKICSSLKPVNAIKYSMNPNDIMSRDSLNVIKKEKYNKQWNFDNYRLPTLSNEEKKVHSQSQILATNDKRRKQENNKNEFNYTFYGLMLDETNNLDANKTKTSNNPNSNFITIKGVKMEALSMLKSFCPPKNNTTKVADLLNKSLLESCGDNAMKKYTNNLKNILGDYVNYADKYSSIYDFDECIRNDMMKFKTGISMPGKKLKAFEENDKFRNLKVFQPSNVYIKVSKSISVPEKAQLPRHPGLVKPYSQITDKQLYF